MQLRSAVFALATTLLVEAPGPLAASEPPGREAYDWAFRFASAIASDADDRSRAQQAVVLELLAQRDRAGALALADGVDGWRRGVVYAELAADLAEDDPPSARDLVRRAEDVRARAAGWENPRIASHIALALAALGDLERSKEIASGLGAEDERQYAGRSAATAALAHAARGDSGAAVRHLASLEGNDDYEVAAWRTSGYLTLARGNRLSRSERRRVLDAARASAVRIPGFKQLEALEQIADLSAELGQRAKAREALAAAGTALDTIPARSPDRAPLMANLARAWARHGGGDRARRLLLEAEPLIGESLDIDRPGLYANLALGHALLGDAGQSQRLFDRAWTAAGELENARPRALAAVAICIALGRRSQPLDKPSRSQLESLLSGLGDPW